MQLIVNVLQGSLTKRLRWPSLVWPKWLVWTDSSKRVKTLRSIDSGIREARDNYKDNGKLKAYSGSGRGKHNYEAVTQQCQLEGMVNENSIQLGKEQRRVNDVRLLVSSYLISYYRTTISHPQTAIKAASTIEISLEASCQAKAIMELGQSETAGDIQESVTSEADAEDKPREGQ